jgi:hypothetical protein
MAGEQKTQETEHKSFGMADEIRELPHGGILDFGGSEIGRYLFKPGRHWSTDDVVRRCGLLG